MSEDRRGIQRFNLETMSGVFPGVRTQVYQRVRLTPMDDSGASPCWGQISWCDTPHSCVVHRLGVNNELLDQTPLARVLYPISRTINQELQSALAATGWRMEACGSCVYWRAGESGDDSTPPRGLCTFQQAHVDAEPTPVILAVQSHLALRCEHWRPANVLVDSPLSAMSVWPLPLAAQVSDSKKRGWERLRMHARKLLSPRRSANLPLAERLVERSGVGAGTEACSACQGRIANLAALAVESQEGDKETLSVWRCRTCFTLYLSDWVDRWERLESLETEETIYRLAPAEALAILTIIDGVAGGDHPRRRSERSEPREWIKSQMRDRAPLSHMIKQGR